MPQASLPGLKQDVSRDAAWEETPRPLKGSDPDREQTPRRAPAGGVPGRRTIKIRGYGSDGPRQRTAATGRPATAPQSRAGTGRRARAAQRDRAAELRRASARPAAAPRGGAARPAAAPRSGAARPGASRNGQAPPAPTRNDAARPRASRDGQAGPAATRTVTGRATRRRPPRRPHERAGFKPDRVAMWAVFLGLLLAIAAATSSHGAMLRTGAGAHMARTGHAITSSYRARGAR
jgi:hypothetical protein